MLINTFARWHTTNNIPYAPTIDNCYYVATTNLPTNQGMKADIIDATPAGQLVADYDLVKAYENGIVYGGTNYSGALHTISLANDADNGTAISNADGYFANVTLTGRTLFKDGKWNTICLLGFSTTSPMAFMSHIQLWSPLMPGPSKQ